MQVRFVALAAIYSALPCSPGLCAQQATPPLNTNPLLAAYDAHLALARTSPFRALNWSFLGPTNLSVRAVDAAVADHGAHRRIYIVYKTGGLWKTDDDGATAQPVLTHLPSMGMSVVTVAPSNPDIIWLGTASGVYKSVDGSRTWHNMGLAGASAGGFELQDGATFGRIVIHPTNPNIVYVAAQGIGDTTNNTTRGVFKTIDGGRTWQHVLYRGRRTGAIDLVMDPHAPGTLYAVTWQNIYSELLGLVPGQDPDSNQTSIWKTTNGGRTWSEVTNGLPAPRFRGRIGIDISRSNPRVLYALLDSHDLLRPAAPGELNRFGLPLAGGQYKGAEVYRTDDGGGTWRKVSKTDAEMINHGNTYGNGFGQIRVDPRDPNTVFTAGIELHVSHNGGHDYVTVLGPHGDHRGLWIDPKHQGVFYDCTDGGLYLFSDHGVSWKLVPAPTSQFYNLALDMATPFHAYGSVQDFASYRGVVDLTRGRDSLHAEAFERAPGGEDSNQGIDTANPDIVYANPNNSLPRLSRYDLSGASGQPLDITPKVPAGEAALRGGGLHPFVVSSHDPQTIYAGYQYLYRSRDRGDHWERISPDLTDNDPAKRFQPPLSARQMITAIAESPKRPGLLYVATDDGHVWMTTDDGRAWTELHLPAKRRIMHVVASAFAEGTFYVIQLNADLADGTKDFSPNILRSTDFGKTFTSVAGNLPTGPVRVVREDPTDPAILYAGTMVGVYVTTNGGARWEVLGGNLPTVPISDLQIHPRDGMIVIATLGRGVWVMDALKVRSRR